MEKLLILDSNSLMNRAFYALPKLTNSEGTNTNAIYGFLNMLLKMKEEINPDYIVAAFDRKAPTFRHKEYEEYKAGRKKMPPELSEQFPIIKESLELLSINIYEIDGYEADDIIGTTAKIAENEGIEVYIVTGDKDALQLATEKTRVIITKKGVSETAVYDSKAFFDEFHVTPTQFIDVKGLMGDKSDNIPGVPGVGEKTAFKLIQEYGTIESVIENTDKISGKKLKENIETYREQAIFSKKLATIIKDVPLDINLEDIKSKENYDKESFKKLLFKLEMKSIADRLFKNDTVEDNINVSDIDTIDGFVSVIENQNKTSYISYSVSDASLFSTIELERIYLGGESQSYNINVKKIKQENEQELLGLLKRYFEDDNIDKVIHDAKSLITVLSKYNIQLNSLAFDTSVAAYLIDSSKGEYSLKNLIARYMMMSISENDDEFIAKQASYIKDIYDILKEKIKKESMEELYYKVELPLVFVLSSMEAEGFKVDIRILENLEVKIKKEIENTQGEIYSLSEEEFNINSPKQLGKILFEKLDLPIIKKTKTGYSTNVDVLLKLKDKHPIIEKIMYFRQVTKLYSTYIEGLKNVIDSDGHIHSTFNQTATTTGRLSSTEPNLQNIPIKYEMGREIRKMFTPEDKGDILLSCDYSQIELRVLAHIADDKNMIDAFKQNIDIHTKTASEVFSVPVEEVTPLMRGRAKAVNFGIVYGIGAFSLSEDINVSVKEAEKYISIYLDRYPNIKKYLDNVINTSSETGFVTTILNRKRAIPEIKSSNKIVNALGKRLAMNAPIQGSAADIIKIAMVNVFNRLKAEKLSSKLILQVHDELILNVKTNEEEQVRKIVKEEMENAVHLKVPMEVAINEGSTWYDAK